MLAQDTRYDSYMNSCIVYPYTIYIHTYHHPHQSTGACHDKYFLSTQMRMGTDIVYVTRHVHFNYMYYLTPWVTR